MFIEFVEIGREMGAQRFMIYRKKIMPSVDKLLDYYIKLGLVQIIPWSMQLENGGHLESFYSGQLGALIDCVFRSQPFSRYLAFYDLVRNRYQSNMM